MNFKLADALVPFGGSAPSVDKPSRSILGGKGLGLQDMSRIGAVPPGFTLVTPLCGVVYEEYNEIPQEIWKQVKEGIERIEKDMGNKFG